jgi:hypothetical protein
VILMAEPQRWQVSTDAAEVYESCFVPAIFGAWASPVADAAGIGAGDKVLCWLVGADADLGRVSTPLAL